MDQSAFTHIVAGAAVILTKEGDYKVCPADMRECYTSKPDWLSSVLQVGTIERKYWSGM